MTEHLRWRVVLNRSDLRIDGYDPERAEAEDLALAERMRELSPMAGFASGRVFRPEGRDLILTRLTVSARDAVAAESRARSLLSDALPAVSWWFVRALPLVDPLDDYLVIGPFQKGGSPIRPPERVVFGDSESALIQAVELLAAPAEAQVTWLDKYRFGIDELWMTFDDYAAHPRVIEHRIDTGEISERAGEALRNLHAYLDGMDMRHFVYLSREQAIQMLDTAPEWSHVRELAQLAASQLRPDA